MAGGTALLCVYAARLIAAVLVGIVCAVVGTYVVLRGMAFFGDALAHAILPGVALGYLVSEGAREPLFWWALGTCDRLCAGHWSHQQEGQIKEDTAIGIIFAGMFALGIALISTVRSYAVDLSHFLFGDVLAVSAQNLWIDRHLQRAGDLHHLCVSTKSS